MKLPHPWPTISATDRSIPRNEEAGSFVGCLSSRAMASTDVRTFNWHTSFPLSNGKDETRSCPMNRPSGARGTFVGNGTN
jgi:hypothetical protein